MSEQDRVRWDTAYADRAPALAPELPAVFAAHEMAFPHEGTALDIACGPGSAAVWLALRGLNVLGVDVSGVAIEQARALAHDAGVAPRCRFDTVDLDNGLPPGRSVDVVLCHRFRDRRLDRAIVDRLAPGGLLAISKWAARQGRSEPLRVSFPRRSPHSIRLPGARETDGRGCSPGLRHNP